MKYFRYLALLLGVVCLAVSCSKDLDENGKYGEIDGSVNDYTTGEPVSVVNVTLSPGGHSTVTGSDGKFNFRNLEPGEYSVSISKEGYKTAASNLFVKSGDPTSAHLLIERIPAIVTADRDTLDFGDNQSLNTRSFNIVNSSYEDLSWEIEERCDWITEVKPSKGTLAYGKTEGIVVVIDRSALAAGENKAVIVIRSSQGSSQMNVKAIGVERELPIINVQAVTDVTTNTATFAGEIISEGKPKYTERGFVYSLQPKPTLENTIVKLSSKMNSNSEFNYNVLDLSSNTKYYVRAYAINAEGVAYSANEVSFMTDAQMPVVKTVDVKADFSGRTATFRGEIANVGDPAYTQRGFVYGVYPEPTINDNEKIANGSGVTGSYSIYATGMPKSTYYVRAYAQNDNGVSYGEQIMVKADWIEIPAAGIAVQTKDIGYTDWSSAALMCEQSTVGGFTDWRLPTIQELMVLYNNREAIGGFDTTSSSSDYRHQYWSSSIGTDGYGRRSYFYLYFTSGETSATESQWLSKSVRAVRTISKK